MADYSIGVDLGGTNLRAAVSTGDIGVLETLGSEPAPATLDGFIARVNALRAEAGSVEALGIAVPGLVEGSVCRWIPNLPFLDGVDIQARFSKLRVALGNDAQTHCWPAHSWASDFSSCNSLERFTVLRKRRTALSLFLTQFRTENRVTLFLKLLSSAQRRFGRAPGDLLPRGPL